MSANLSGFTDIFGEEIGSSQPISLPSSNVSQDDREATNPRLLAEKPAKYTGQHGEYRSNEEIDPKYRSIFSYRYFNLVQSRVIDDALYSDKSMVVCAPTGSGKTVIFEMAIVQLLMEIEKKGIDVDFKIIYMAPVKSLCTERLTEWYPKFTKLGHLCIEVTGDTNVEFHQLKPYRIIITTPEKWNMFTRRWPDHRGLVGLIKLFLIDEVHILNDEMRGPVLEAVVSRMKTIEASVQSEHRQQLLKLEVQPQCSNTVLNPPPRIRFVAVSATVSNPEDVKAWLSTPESPAIFYKFGDECRPVKVRRIVEGYPCYEGTSIFKFDIILNYKLWPVIQKYHDGKPTLIFCNTRKSVTMTAETLSRELTVTFSPEQRAKLTALASTIKNKKLQALVLAGVGCHHAGLLFEERVNIENSFRNRDLPILITTTTLAMGVNLPAHLVIIKNTQQYVNGAYQEYSISTILQMVGRAGRPQFDTSATAVIMTTLKDKHRYQALVEGSEPLQSYLHKRIAENLNSEAALGTVGDVAQCVQWLRSTFLYVRAGKDPRRYLALPHNAPSQQINNKIEELCVKAMNGLASAGLITMDETSCITSTEAGRLMSIYYIDLETMKLIMKIDGTETLDKMLYIICECHELSDMHLRMDERRLLNTLNRNNKANTIRFPMKGKITTRQMKLSCVIQAVLGCLPIQDPSLNQEAMKIMRIADRICKCVVSYVTRPESVSQKPNFYFAVLNSILLAKCIYAHLWENSPYVSKQLKGIGPTFSTLLASAGKTSFMMLEESHPRDLERIMNKGAPAGNILRKQVSLLPKYHLTATPTDSNTVLIKLSLLNIAFLAENMEHLTAGTHHKCFVIIGDSNNKLLLLTSFQDKDLIDVYDGTICYGISRQYHFEHKIHAHCISTELVGIDAQCDYVFRELEPLYTPHMEYGNTENETSCINPPESIHSNTRNFIQPSIADIYKERKRKNNTDVTQSKEKRKRDCALVKKYKILKENFGIASNELRKSINKSTEKTNLLLQELTTTETNAQFPEIDCGNPLKSNFIEDTDFLIDLREQNLEDIEDVCINNEEVDTILNEIEKEIFTNNKSTNENPTEDLYDGNKLVQSYFYLNNDYDPRRTVAKKNPCNVNQHSIISKSKKQIYNKTNYSFIDAIEQKNEKDVDSPSSDMHAGLSNDIKFHIEKFLQNQNNIQVAKDKVLYNRIIDPILNIPNSNETQKENICMKATLENEKSDRKDCIILNNNSVHNSACNEIEGEIDDEHEGLSIIKSNKLQLGSANKVLKETYKNHNMPNVPQMEHELKYENGNAEACQIVKYHSDDDLIILSSLEEDISDLATQKVLPLSLDSDSEACYKNIYNTDLRITGLNVEHNINMTTASTNDNSLLVSDRSAKSNESVNTSNYNKNHSLKYANFTSTEPIKDHRTYQETENSNTKREYIKEQHTHDNNFNFPRNSNIKGYLYSRTDISIATKTLPDRQISMIKKVTVDLNVTEILTKTNKLEGKCSIKKELGPSMIQEVSSESEVSQPQPCNTLNERNILVEDTYDFDAKQKQVTTNKQNTSTKCIDFERPGLVTNDKTLAKYINVKSFHETTKNQIPYACELNDVENKNELQAEFDDNIVEKTNSYPIHVTCTKRTKNKFVCPVKPINYTEIKLNDSREHSLYVKKGNIDKTIDQNSNTDRNLTLTEMVTSDNICPNAPKINCDVQNKKDYINEDFKINQTNSYTNSTDNSNDNPKTVVQKNVTVDANAYKNFTIENVLQKYTRVLLNRKQATCQNFKDETNRDSTQDTSNKMEIVPKIEARKKYKISDINNDKVPIPNLFSDIIGLKKGKDSDERFKSISDLNIRSSMENNIGHFYRSNPKQSSPNLTSPQNIKHDICLSQQSDINDDEDNTINFATKDLQIDCEMDDFKLDESLLDPKRLLQTVDDEESGLIIPPPPEFSHSTSIYSPAKSDLANYTATDYDTEFMIESPKLSPDFNDTADFMSGDYENHEVKELELTPSKEIETWSLERDNDDHDYVFRKNSFNLTPPFSTISSTSTFKISRNTKQSFTQPVSVNRRILQDFKYTQKDRLNKNSQLMSSLQRGIQKRPYVKRF